MGRPTGTRRSSRVGRALGATITVLTLAGLTACSDGGDSADKTSTTEPAPPAKFVILLTNDDGISGPGIDVMAQALQGLSDVELVISAPAENQSGTSDNTTEGTVPEAKAETLSGIEGTAVSGFPADAVTAGLAGGLKPTLVISGINAGQNIGPLAALSGTVGAAKTAARAGYPAVAVSMGLADDPDYASAAQLVLDWMAEHRSDLLEGKVEPQVVSFNVPACAAGTELKDLVEVPLQPDGTGRDVLSSNCASTATDPKDDIEAFNEGYPSMSEVDFAE